jgi:hypothetical protein
MPTATQIGLVKLGLNVVASASVWKVVSEVIKNKWPLKLGDVVKFDRSLIIG